MAETMLYVNEHLHDQLWDGEVGEGVIRSFAPGDYLVFEVADGDAVVVSGHPAERGTFELFLRAFEVGAPRRRPPLRSTWPRRQANFEALRAELLDAARSIPDAATFEEQFSHHQLAVGRAAHGAGAGGDGLGPPAGCHRRGVRSR